MKKEIRRTVRVVVVMVLIALPLCVAGFLADDHYVRCVGWVQDNNPLPPATIFNNIPNPPDCQRYP